MLLKYFLKDFEMVPVAPIITGILLLLLLLDFNLVTALPLDALRRLTVSAGIVVYSTVCQIRLTICYQVPSARIFPRTAFILVFLQYCFACLLGILFCAFVLFRAAFVLAS
jgi:hypothetical protein